MNKLNRVSAILVRLQSRRIVTAQQMADQFGVSLRTIYRDIRVLEESGVPIVGNAGYGYSLMDGYKLPPLMFTTEEALAFLMAEKVVSKQTDKDSYDLYRSGMDKIRAVLRSTENEILENTDNFIRIVDTHTSNQPQPTNVLQPLLLSIIRKKVVKIEYHANYSQELTIREAEPIGLFYMMDSWYVLAYCLLRNDYRTFKVNRIWKITSSEKEFERNHSDLKTLIRELYHDDESYKVKIRVEKSVLQFISVGKYMYGLQKEEITGDYIEQEYVTYSLENFSRWYISFADKAEIIEPIELKDIVRETLRKIKI